MDTAIHAIQHETDLWLARVKAWQASAGDLGSILQQTQQRASLGEYLRRLHKRLRLCLSVPDALQTLPLVGQLLGRLTILPRVTLDDGLYAGLLACVMYFYVHKPRCNVEVRSKAWVMNQLHSLVSQTHGTQKDGLLCGLTGHSVQDYHRECATVMMPPDPAPSIDDLPNPPLPSPDPPVTDPRTLVSVCTVCMSLRQRQLYGAVWRRSLAALLSHHAATEETLGVVRELVESQRQPYTGPQPVPPLPYHIQTLVWTTSRSSLEHEVTDLIDRVTERSAGTDWQQRVTERWLIRACTQCPHIHRLVFDVLRCVLEETGGWWGLVRLTGWLYSRVYRAAKQQVSLTGHQHHSDIYKPLVCLLAIQPRDLTWEAISHHIDTLASTVQTLCVHEGPSVPADVRFICVQHLHWYTEILTHVFTCRRRTVESCVQLLLILHPSSQNSFEVAVDILLSLRGLYTKTSLCEADLRCALSAVLSDPSVPTDPSVLTDPSVINDPNTQAKSHVQLLVVSHLLLVFGLMSASGHRVIGEILDMVCGTGLSDEQRIAAVLDTVELISDTKAMSPGKTQHVCSLVSELMDKTDDTFRNSGVFKWYKARLKHLY